uniref:Macro domain-containing protein n=1 Tax=Acrobeloides nanus TaxID=290746 RepID=A0A914D0H9_9BILA
MDTYCKISLMHGDITKAPADIIVNATNKHLCGGSGVDGAIHKAAGPGLIQECMKIGACATGNAVVTHPYNIKQAKAIIHTVGPQISGYVKSGQMIRKVDDIDERLLEDCYISSLNLAVSLKRQCQSIYNGDMIHTPQELHHTASSLKSQVDDIKTRLQGLDTHNNIRF